MKCSKCNADMELVGGNWHEELHRCPNCDSLKIEDR